MSTSYGYSAARDWLLSVATTTGATSIESLAYARDSAGRITSVGGGRADESWSYGYNDLDQLLSAANSNSPALSQSFTYSVGGNILSNSAVGLYAYPTQGSTAVQPHAVSSAGPWLFAYDLNGNQVSRSTATVLDREIAYDAENRPVSVTTPGATVTYLYGPDGARLKKVSGSDTTLYIGDDIERDPAGGFTVYLGADVKRVAGANHRHSSIALMAFSPQIAPLERFARWDGSKCIATTSPRSRPSPTPRARSTAPPPTAPSAKPSRPCSTRSRPPRARAIRA